MKFHPYSKTWLAVECQPKLPSTWLYKQINKLQEGARILSCFLQHEVNIKNKKNAQESILLE